MSGSSRRMAPAVDACRYMFFVAGFQRSCLFVGRSDCRGSAWSSAKSTGVGSATTEHSEANLVKMSNRLK